MKIKILLLIVFAFLILNTVEVSAVEFFCGMVVGPGDIVTVSMAYSCFGLGGPSLIAAGPGVTVNFFPATGISGDAGFATILVLPGASVTITALGPSILESPTPLLAPVIDAGAGNALNINGNGFLTIIGLTETSNIGGDSISGATTGTISINGDSVTLTGVTIKNDGFHPPLDAAPGSALHNLVAAIDGDGKLINQMNFDFGSSTLDIELWGGLPPPPDFPAPVRTSGNNNDITITTQSDIGGRFKFEAKNLFNSRIRGDIAVGDGQGGISIKGSHDLVLSDLYIENADIAVWVDPSYNITIANSTFANSVNCLVIDNSTITTLVDNVTFMNCSVHAVNITNGSSNNEIRNSTFINNTIGIGIYGESYNNTIYWNRFMNLSTPWSYFAFDNNLVPYGNFFNISVGGKAQGNYWADVFDKSLQIYDTDGDGFGDSGAQYPYMDLNGGNVSGVVDYGPMAPLQLTGCGQTISTSTTLSGNLSFNGTGICINNSNVVLDCSVYSIKGNTSGYGIFVPNLQNVTIENCTVINFTTGISFNGTTSSFLYNNHIKRAYQNGIEMLGGGSNIASRNRAHNITNSGFYMENSNDNNLTNNAATGNTSTNFTTNSTTWDGFCGLNLNNSARNLLINNSGDWVDNYGFCLFGSGNNTLINNTAFTGGSTAHVNYGYYLFNSSDNTLLRNIGFKAGMDCFRLDYSNNNNLSDNNNGTDSGVNGFVFHYSHNNALIDFKAFNGGTNGIYVNFSDNNTIKNGNISDAGLYGLISDYSNGNNMTNLSGKVMTSLIRLVGSDSNTILNSNGVNNGYDFDLVNSSFNILMNNTGTRSNTACFYLENSHENNMTNNTVYNTPWGDGFEIYSGSSRNIMRNNFVNVSSGWNCFDILDSNNNTLINNIIQGCANDGIVITNSNYTSVIDTPAFNSSNFDINVVSSVEVLLSDYSFNPYSFSNAGLILERNPVGMIRFLNTSITESKSSLVSDVNFNTNLIRINSTNAPGLNQSANLTFYGINFTNPEPIWDPEDDGSFVPCPANICTELSYIGTNYTYNVTQFSGFGSNESPVPNITVNKTDYPDPVYAGSQLNYTITYFNNGSANATSFFVKEIYPPQVSFVSAVPTPDPGTNDSWTIGTVANGTGGTINITVLVNANVSNNTNITNFVNFKYLDSLGIILFQNQTNETTLVLSHAEGLPNMTINKTDDPDPVYNGTNLNYTITYCNNGTSNALNVLITETYDANITFVSAIPSPTFGNNTWNFSIIQPGICGTINITVLVNGSIANNTNITNIVNISYYDDPGIKYTGSDTEITLALRQPEPPTNPNLVINKTDDPDPVYNGTYLNYTITYCNNGTDSANSIFVNETYDANVNYVSSSPLPAMGTNNTWWLAMVDPGNCSTVNITVLVNASIANNTNITNVVNFTYLNGSGDMLFAGDTEITLALRPPEPTPPTPTPSVGGGGGGIRRYIPVNQTPQQPVVQASCLESWLCDGWSPCENNMQMRSCVDLKNCGTATLKPVESRSCTPVQQPVLETPAPVPEPVIERPQEIVAPKIETVKRASALSEIIKYMDNRNIIRAVALLVMVSALLYMIYYWSVRRATTPAEWEGKSESYMKKQKQIAKKMLEGKIKI